MIIGFADRGWEDHQHWIANDKKIFKRINLLLKDIKRNPLDDLIIIAQCRYYY